MKTSGSTSLLYTRQVQPVFEQNSSSHTNAEQPEKMVHVCSRRPYFARTDRYALLSALVERQVADGRRDTAPRILPVVLI